MYPDPDPDPTPPAANGDPAADAAPPAASAKDNDSFRDRTKDEATRGAEWLEGTSDMLEIGGAVGFLAIAGAGCATGTYCSAGLMAGYTVAQIAWKSAAAATVVAGGLRCWAGDYDGCSRDLFWGTVGGGLSLLAPVSVEQRAGTAAMHLASVAVGHLTDPGAW